MSSTVRLLPRVLFAGVLATAIAVAGLVVPAANAAVFTDDVPTPSVRVNGRIYATVIVGDVVYIGGQFTTATRPDGTTATRRNLAAFRLSDGSLVEEWQANSSGLVRALATDGSSLWVGGSFTTVRNIAASRVAKVSLASGTVDTTFRGSVDGGVRALAVDSSSLYVGGTFLNAGTPAVARRALAKMSKTSGALDAAFNANLNEAAYGLVKHPTANVLYAAGRFSSIGGTARNGVAGVNASTGQATTTVFGSAARPTLGLSINPDGTRLFGAGGAGSNAAAAWNTANGTRVWRQVVDGDIQAVAYYGGTVYFGFHDGYQADPTAKMLAADAATGQLQDFRPVFNLFWGVFAIAASSGGVVAGGEFTNVSGVQATNLARFTPTSRPPVEPVTVRYVGSADPLSYWDSGTRPTGWPAANAASWATGLPQLGYGDGDEATVVSFGPNASSKYPTTYFSATFQVAEVPDALELELLADDGAVVYLNGVEVVRDNMPAGTVGHGTLASTDRSGGPENALRPFQIDPTRLRVGTNTIAIEVHQASLGSSDLGVDLDLVGELRP